MRILKTNPSCKLILYFVTINLCCSHFIKMVVKDADKFNHECKSYFAEVVAAAILFTNPEIYGVVG